MQQTFNDGEAREHEEVLFAKDGRKVNALCTTAPLHNAEGEVEAVIEMSIDITQIRQLQSQLASIGLLVGSISHGIKGLLTGLDGGVYMVRVSPRTNPRGSKKARKWFRAMWKEFVPWCWTFFNTPKIVSLP